MTATPASRASPGPARTTGSPSSTTVPESGWWTPVSVLIRVDLPAPFSPHSACTDPPYSSSDTPRRAATLPNDLLTSTRPITGRSASGRSGSALSTALPRAMNETFQNVTQETVGTHGGACQAVEQLVYAPAA